MAPTLRDLSILAFLGNIIYLKFWVIINFKAYLNGSSIHTKCYSNLG